MGTYKCDYALCKKHAVYSLSDFKEKTAMRIFLKPKYNFCYDHLQLFFDNFKTSIKYGVFTFAQGPPK